jgi:hypothetical protein
MRCIRRRLARAILRPQSYLGVFGTVRMDPSSCWKPETRCGHPKPMPWTGTGTRTPCRRSTSVRIAAAPPSHCSSSKTAPSLAALACTAVAPRFDQPGRSSVTHRQQPSIERKPLAGVLTGRLHTWAGIWLLAGVVGPCAKQVPTTVDVGGIRRRPCFSTRALRSSNGDIP